MEYCPDNYDVWRWHEEEQERRQKMIDRNEESEDEDG